MIGRVARTAPIVSVLLGLVAMTATVPGSPVDARSKTRRVVKLSVPEPVSIDEDERGFVVNVWVNGAGPFNFVVDTGAGGSVISTAVAAKAGVGPGRSVRITGVSGRVSAGREVPAVPIAAGSRTNRLPSYGALLVSERLPTGVDGLLDPTSSYWPLGFVIDVPAGTLSAFDPITSPISPNAIPDGGTVTPWRSRGGSRRAFVTLAGDRTALIDTGSSLGLVVSTLEARRFGVDGDQSGSVMRIQDIGGGVVNVRRASIGKVALGSMLLRNVPTHVMSGGTTVTPILLGRAVLRPFAIAFDPRSRLIRFDPR